MARSRRNATKSGPMSEQEIDNMYEAMMSELNRIYSNINEVMNQVVELTVAISALQPLDPRTSVFCMISGFLMRGHLLKILPRIRQNREELKEILVELEAALEDKNREIAEFEARTSIPRLVEAPSDAVSALRGCSAVLWQFNLALNMVF
ncbi:prefoldin subunit 2-like [Prosopis cineraria]|uniref:prefoldin subunit 2-like n=1 Tax=Prosopis cineraria TaxID=364024 RepID=UPI00241064E9|nr:prefoldin subunit 2-like [Prosopis cineraria]